MTRYKIAHEGILTLNTIIEVGALKWDDGEEIPVVWNFDFNRTGAIMGKARELQREEDGTITATIEWLENYKIWIDEGDLAINPDNSSFIHSAYLTIYANQVDREKVDPIQRIKSAHLRCISAVVGPDPWSE